MRKALLAATALVGSVIFLVPGAQAFDWNGRYVGGVVGIVKSTGSIDFEYFPIAGGPDSIEFDGIGGLAGITWGFNYKLSDKMVVGVEADASVASLKSSASGSNFDFPPWIGEFEETLESLLTLRGRLGALSPDGNTLFYATAGLAGGQVTLRSFIDNGIGPEPIAATTSGFAIGLIGGVGIEHAIKDDLTVKAEILAYQLGSLSGIGDIGKGEFEATHNPSGIIFRTGLNFHF